MREGFRRQVLPLLCWLAAFALMIVYYANYGGYTFNADLSSEMVLADLLNAEGTLLSPNWLYSTELRVVSPVPVYQLGLMLFSTWHGARVFSIAVLMLGVTLSLLYALRGAGAGDIALYAAAAIILPVSWQYTFLFSYGGFYTVYFIVTCLLMGLVLRLDRSKGRVRRLLLIALLSVYSGLGGVRMPMVCGAPLLAACAVRLFGRMMDSTSIREVVDTEEMTKLMGAAFSFAVMAAGYLLNSQVLSKMYSFKQYGDLSTYAYSMEDTLEQLGFVPMLLGLREGVLLTSVEGFFGLCAAGVALLLPLSVVGLYRIRTRLTAGEKIIVLYAVIACTLGILLNVVTQMGKKNMYSVSYYLIGLLMLLTCIFLLPGRLPVLRRGIRNLLSMALFAVFFGNAIFALNACYAKSPGTVNRAAQWLVENGYEKGFATFWNGNVLTEASDGALEMYVFGKWGEAYPSAWLQKAAHQTDMPEGRVFVYVRDTEMSYSPCVVEENKVWADPGGAIFAFDSAQNVLALQNIDP